MLSFLELALKTLSFQDQQSLLAMVNQGALTLNIISWFVCEGASG